ncbi:hypothetical protein, partial [Burkholderia pseudomallei]|uniref:hypothetical protein n=1 Tax=Burkholderia pseudomallei TaxID=28450 RepID=UPI0013663555
ASRSIAESGTATRGPAAARAGRARACGGSCTTIWTLVPLWPDVFNAAHGPAPGVIALLERLEGGGLSLEETIYLIENTK